MVHFVLILHVLACLSLIALVLLQQGKGAAVGATYGGASQTLFGSRGATSFLFKLTAGLAALFFATSLILANVAVREHASPLPLPQSVDAAASGSTQQDSDADVHSIPEG